MSLPGATIVSRDWNDVAEGTASTGSMGTSAQGQILHEPLRGWASFSATFLVMFKEEGRKSIEFAKKRQIVLFPLLLTLITALTTVGLQFLVGDSSAQVADIEQKTFTWGELRFALHLPLLMFSLGMGTFAFIGHDAIVHRACTKYYLLAAPALQPLPNSVAHFAYFIKDLCFYVMLILSPVIAGMALGILLETVDGVNTPLEWSSLPWTWLAMIITLGQGLAVASWAHRFGCGVARLPFLDQSPLWRSAWLLALARLALMVFCGAFMFNRTKRRWWLWQPLEGVWP